MRLYAVTVYVEAEDSVHAIDVAGDLWVDVEEVQHLAALDEGTVKVRPARKNEGPVAA
jgi:hypothetical protein